LFPWPRNNWEYYQNSAWLSENFNGRRSAALRKEEALKLVLDPPLWNLRHKANERAAHKLDVKLLAEYGNMRMGLPASSPAESYIIPASETDEACSITSAKYLREIAIVSSHLLPRLNLCWLHSVTGIHANKIFWSVDSWRIKMFKTYDSKSTSYKRLKMSWFP